MKYILLAMFFIFVAINSASCMDGYKNGVSLRSMNKNEKPSHEILDTDVIGGACSCLATSIAAANYFSEPALRVIFCAAVSVSSLYIVKEGYTYYEDIMEITRLEKRKRKKD